MFADKTSSSIGMSVVPNILGFSVGSMAMVLSVCSTFIFKHLAEDGNPKSFFMILIANFVYYIVMQSVTIILCAFDLSRFGIIFNFLTSIFVIYSICSVVAMAVQIYQVSVVANVGASVPSDED